MTLLQKKITEREAVDCFIRTTMDVAKESWPSIRKDVLELSALSHLRDLPFQDEDAAPFDFALAIVAQDLEAANNLYDQPQAGRIAKLVIESFDYKDEEHKALGEYAVQEIAAYRKRLHTDTDPIYAIAIRLLERWLGKDCHALEVPIDGKLVIDPLFLSLFNPIISCCCGFWKTTNDNYLLVEHELPFDDSRSRAE